MNHYIVMRNYWSEQLK